MHFIINFNTHENDYECYNCSTLELDSNLSIISYGCYYTGLNFLNGFIRKRDCRLSSIPRFKQAIGYLFFQGIGPVIFTYNCI